MAEVVSLSPFLADRRLHRGAVLPMMVTTKVNQTLMVLVEHVEPGYLIASYTQDAGAMGSLVGAAVRMRWETDTAVTTLDMQVVQEGAVWPVSMLRLQPVGLVSAAKGQPQLYKPDVAITIPYKVMGARPIEENGTGNLLSFSPEGLVMSTDGFVSVGEFLHLSFQLPGTPQELVAMAKAVEKAYENGKSVIGLIFTDMNEKHQKALRDYYRKISQAASS